MKEKSTVFRIAIIGGGIAGLALAIGLRHRNLPFTVYEASPSPSADGAGIALGPNSTRAMALIDPALRILYDSISSGNPLGKEHVFATFLLAEPGFGAEQGFFGAEVGSQDFVKSGAHRKDLMDVMLRLLAPGDVVYGKKAIQIKQTQYSAQVTFSDGETVEVDAVIGCDGGKGISRHTVLSERFPSQVPVSYSKRYVYRAILPPGVGQEILGKYSDDGKMFLGKGNYFALYRLPGQRFNLVAGRQKNESWTGPKWTHEVTREEMLSDFAESDSRLLNLLDWSEPVRWGLFHHENTSTYHNRRVLLLGDVAHASTPHQGSGAGQCFEDALMLSHLLSLVHDKKELDAAFQVYDSICRPRAQEIVRTSNEAGLLYTLSHPTFGEHIDRIVENANQRFQWIWTHNLVADLKRAENGFGELRSKQSFET